jgi:predicted nucleotidyltransferase
LRGVQRFAACRWVVGCGMESVQFEEMRDGLELDLVTHDAKKFFGLMLKKNGYVLEQLFSPLIVLTSPRT